MLVDFGRVRDSIDRQSTGNMADIAELDPYEAL